MLTQCKIRSKWIVGKEEGLFYFTCAEGGSVVEFCGIQTTLSTAATFGINMNLSFLFFSWSLGHLYVYLGQLWMSEIRDHMLVIIFPFCRTVNRKRAPIKLQYSVEEGLAFGYIELSYMLCNCKQVYQWLVIYFHWDLWIPEFSNGMRFMDEWMDWIT